MILARSLAARLKPCPFRTSQKLGAGRDRLGSLGSRDCGSRGMSSSGRRFRTDLAACAAEGLELCEPLFLLVHAHSDELDDRLRDPETAFELEDYRSAGLDRHQDVIAVV